MTNMVLHEKWSVDGGRLYQLETKYRELDRAKSLICRLRAQRDAMLADRRATQEKAIEFAEDPKLSIKDRYLVRLTLSRLGFWTPGQSSKAKAARKALQEATE